MALFKSGEKAKNADNLLYLAPEEIAVSSSIRKSFDQRKILELAKSIEQNGLLQPICVERIRHGYKLIFGERRLKACIFAGIKSIPCILINTDQPKLFNLLENMQRDDLTFFEQAEGIQTLIKEYGFTRHSVSIKLGLSESAISNKLRLLRLTPSQRESIENMALTERHARTLLRICDEKMRTAALREIIDRGMNVEEAERYVDRLLIPKAAGHKGKLIVKDIRLFVNSINKAINVMKISGIDAKSSREEDEDYIKYTVLIPKRLGESEKNEAI